MHFPGLAVRAKIPALLNLAEREGCMVAMKAFRAWVDENPYSNTALLKA